METCVSKNRAGGGVQILDSASDWTEGAPSNGRGNLRVVSDALNRLSGIG
jgi:hypothetical protein